MASGVQCEGKKAYATKYKAERALDLIWKTSWNQTDHLRPCRTYRCAYCKKWHLTSKALVHKADRPRPTPST